MGQPDTRTAKPQPTHDTSPERAEDRGARERQEPQPETPLGDARKRSLRTADADADRREGESGREGEIDGEKPSNDARDPRRHDPFGDVARDERAANDAGNTWSPERPLPPPPATPSGHTRALSPQRRR